MRPLGRIPPGRAGRMWLTRRLGTARRGRDQLDRKLRILVQDQRRLQLAAEQRRTEWRTACALAETWLLRTSLLGGQDVVSAATAPHLAQVEVTWASHLGLAYPAGVEPVGAPGSDHVVGNAALGPAVAAFRVALLAGARSAAADEAVRLIEEETALTRRRLRAMERRWIPWLEAAQRERQLVLDQGEQEDGMRSRGALPGSGGG